MSNKTIHIGFALNNNYVKYLAATMASILSNLPVERNIFFHIITGDINTENKRRLNTLQSIHPFEIEYIPALTEKALLIPRNHNTHVSAETNFRLEITSLKPELDKILFLDADLIVNTDISVLWDMDITDYCAACVPDAPNYKGSNENFRVQAALKEYYNTGVCLMNLKQCRQNDITRRMEEAVRSHADILRYPDQDLLNIGFKDNVLSLPHFWNIMVVAIDWFYPPEIIRHFADVLFENLQQPPSLSISLFQEYLSFRKTLWHYYTYKLLSKITWGKKRTHYKQQRDKWHEKVRRVRLLKNASKK